MKKIFILSIITLLFCFCSKDRCSEEIGFKLDYHLFNKINVKGQSYCDIIKKSLNGEKEAIIDLSKVKVSDGASYQHGAVLIIVIDKLSESKYLEYISDLNQEEKSTIYYAIWAGLDFTNNQNYEGKRIEQAFPELAKCFKYENPSK